MTDPRCRNLPATDKLLWAVLERMIEDRRTRLLDFGRTRPVASKLFFKRKWGAQENGLFYTYLLQPGTRVPQILPENPALRPAIDLWRRMPNALRRRLGPLLRPRIPT